MKRAIVATLTRMLAVRPQELDAKTEHYSITSFDIFDTLVKRDVRCPDDLFAIVGRGLQHEFPEYDLANYRTMRIEAERKARKHSPASEVTINDIYAYLPLPEQVRRAGEALELRLEIDLAEPNEEMVAFYRRRQSQSRRVVLVSDMYLPVETVERVLEKCGISGYEKLYLSSELGATKNQGGIFPLVAADLGVEASSIVHIGDSLRSDFYKPRRAGFGAYLYGSGYSGCEEFLSALDQDGSMEAGAIAALARNTCPSEQDDFYRFGYSCLGPYLLGFSRWLEKRLGEKGIEKVFFLSRDGLILKRAFEVTATQQFDIHYLEVSRRSLRIPLLWMTESLEEIVDMMPPSRTMSVTALFDTVGLEEDNYADVLNECGIEVDETLETKNIGADSRVVTLLERLRDDYVKKSKEQFEALETYIVGMGFGGRFAVVDIGWSGGMQRYLATALSKMGVDNDISGFYTGIVTYADRNVKYANLDLNGFVFDCLEDGPQADCRRFYVGFLETLFLEQAGTVVGYSMTENGAAVAVRAEYEYADNGGLLDEAQDVRKIQNGAIDFVRAASKKEAFSLLEGAPETFFAGIHKAGAAPSKKILEMFADFRFFDDGATGRLAAPRKLLSYIVKPRLLKTELLASRWKTAFAKRLLHNAPLPYQNVLASIAKRGE